MRDFNRGRIMFKELETERLFLKNISAEDKDLFSSSFLMMILIDIYLMQNRW